MPLSDPTSLRLALQLAVLNGHVPTGERGEVSPIPEESRETVLSSMASGGSAHRKPARIFGDLDSQPS